MASTRQEARDHGLDSSADFLRYLRATLDRELTTQDEAELNGEGITRADTGKVSEGERR